MIEKVTCPHCLGAKEVINDEGTEIEPCTFCEDGKVTKEEEQKYILLLNESLRELGHESEEDIY